MTANAAALPASGSASRRGGALIAIAVVITWLNGGVNFLAFKIGADAMPAVFLAALRFTTAGLVLVPLALWRIRTYGVPGRREIASTAALGLLMLVGGQTLTLWGTGQLLAGVASVFGSAPPIFLALFAWLVFRSPLGTRQLAGIGIGLVGIVFIGLSSASSAGFHPIGAIAILVANAIWASGSLLQHRIVTIRDPIASVTVQLLTAGVVLWPVAGLTGVANTDIFHLSRPVLASLAFLTFFSTLIGYGLFTWLNVNASSTLANTYNYVSPVIAIVLAAAFLGESLSVTKIAAAAVALVGVGLMVGGPTTGARR